MLLDSRVMLSEVSLLLQHKVITDHLNLNFQNISLVENLYKEEIE